MIRASSKSCVCAWLSALDPTVSCPLDAGWNLVGDPLNKPLALPGGTVGFWWDPEQDSYRPVDQIPFGGAIWLYSSTAQTVTLQPAGTVAGAGGW